MSECREVQLGEVCYTSAGVSQTLFVTHVYDHDGSLVAVVYHDVAGNPVDTSAGVVGIGRCDCPQTVVEVACLRTVAASGDPLPGTFETHTIDTSVFTHLHWVVDNITGNAQPGGAPPPGPNPSPVDITDVGAVNAVLNAAFGGAIAYTYIAPTTGIFYATNATIAAAQPNSLWIGDVADYDDKASLDAFDPVPGPGGTTLRSVEVVKTLACDGSVSVRIVEQDGSPIEPQPLVADWTLGQCQTVLDRVEVCVNIGTTVVEAWVVHVRDAISGAILSSFMEDAQGATVTGNVVECPCPGDVVVVASPNRQCFGYSHQPLNSAVDGYSGMMATAGSSRYSPATYTPPFDTCGPANTNFAWAIMSLVVNGVETLTAPLTVSVPFASLTFNANGTPTNYAAAFNAMPEIASADIIFTDDLFSPQHLDTKPFTMLLWQGPAGCVPTSTSDPASRFEILSTVGGTHNDGWGYGGGTWAAVGAGVDAQQGAHPNVGSFNAGSCVPL
jgi:hypothetical protein